MNADDYMTRNSVIRIHNQTHHSGDQIENNEMDGASGTYGGQERCIQGFGGEP